MNRIMVIISSLSLTFLLIASVLGNTNMRALAQANYTIGNIPYIANHTTLNIGSPQKVTIPLDSQQQPTILSDEKKQQLIQHNHQSPPLPSSGKPIRGPSLGTQTSP